MISAGVLTGSATSSESLARTNAPTTARSRTKRTATTATRTLIAPRTPAFQAARWTYSAVGLGGVGAVVVAAVAINWDKPAGSGTCLSPTSSIGLREGLAVLSDFGSGVTCVIGRRLS